ncbi:MarR family transcriptional regulator [Oscillospiraceae bacterium MB08-C2-2]|nr:MarR family transcriptional regulator [Oscillospiraceae bacterium MB08-C2-2]
MEYCRVTNQFFDIIRLLEEEKKKPKDYGVGASLYYAEVMFLESIAQYPNENVSDLSKRLGITKGAVTQMSAKLLQKNVIEAVKRADNKKEKSFRLTEGGKLAIKGHQQFHEQANQKLCDFFATLDRDEMAVIFRFLGCLRECIPFCEFPCHCGEEKRNNKEAAYHEPATTECAQFTGDA